MKTTEKIRFSEAGQYITLSPLSEIYGVELFEIDQNANIGLGSFSKALCKTKDSIGDCIQWIQEHYRGHADLLIKNVSTQKRVNNWHTTHGWQVWERRQHTGRRVDTGMGSRMPKKSLGTGKIYIV